MSAGGNVSTRLVLDYSKFTPASAEVMSQVDALTAKIKALESQIVTLQSKGGGGAGGGGGGGMFGGLAEVFGKKSALGQIEKLMMGGGAIAAVGMAAREFGLLGEKVGQLADGMRAGALSAEDFYMELTSSLPVIGNIQKGIIGIAQAISPVGRDLSKQIMALGDEAAKLKTKAEAETAGTPVEKAKIEAAAAYKEEVARIRQLEKEMAGEDNQYAGTAHKLAEQAIKDAERIRDAAIANAAKGKEEKDAITPVIDVLEKKNIELDKGKAALLEYDLYMKGATDDEIDYALAIQQANEEMEAAKEDEKKYIEALAQKEEKIKGITDELWQQAQTYGMSEAQIRAFRLAQEGADKATIKWADDTANWLDKQKAWDEEVKRGAELWKQYETPLQKYGEEVEEFEKLLDDGVWTWEQYATAVEAANKKLDEADKKNKDNKIGQRETADAMLSRIQGALIENAFGERQKQNKETQYTAENKAVEKTASHTEQTVKALDRANATLDRIEAKKSVATFQ